MGRGSSGLSVGNGGEGIDPGEVRKEHLIRRQEGEEHQQGSQCQEGQGNGFPQAPAAGRSLKETGEQKKSCRHQQHIEGDIDRRRLAQEEYVIDIARRQHDGAERQRGQHPGDAAALLAAAGEIEETQEIGPKQNFQMFP